MHDGNFTCGQCEPGLVQQDSIASSSYDSPATYHEQQLTAQGTHKQQLKKLKKRYGLQNNSELDKFMHIKHILTFSKFNDE